MEYLIAGGLNHINFAPATVAEEILQNIKCILSTVKFSVPLDRDFGIDISCLDLPLPVAQNMLTLEVVQKVELYEPRVKVDEVTLSLTGDGQVTAKVVLSSGDR